MALNSEIHLPLPPKVLGLQACATTSWPQSWLLGGPQPLTVQEQPWALHTILTIAFTQHALLSEQSVRLHSVAVHTKPVGTLLALVHEGAEGWGPQRYLLRLGLSCPASCSHLTVLF